MKNLKFNTKKIKAIMLLSTSLVLCGCSKTDEDKKKIIEVLEEAKDTTYFDEIMESERLDNLYLLEEYLEISKNLHDTKFQRIEDVDRNEQELLTPDEIRGKLYLYQARKNLSNKEQEDLDRTLTIQEKQVNSKIYYSYNFMANATLIALKTEILTVKGLDETAYDTINIQEYSKSGLDIPGTCYVYIDEYKANINSSLGNLLKSVYLMQQEGETGYTYKTINVDIYNSDRNKFIQDAIDNIKNVLREDYTPNRKNILKRVKK